MEKSGRVDATKGKWLMMCERWQRNIDSISYVKPETIDKEKIKKMLKYDYTHDEQVLDNLYLLGVLTLDEYKEFMGRQLERAKEHIHWLEERLADADKNGEKYNPMAYYGFGGPYFGAEVDFKLNRRDNA